MFGAGEYWILLVGVVPVALSAIWMLTFYVRKNQESADSSQGIGTIHKNQAVRVSFITGVATCGFMMVSMASTIVSQQHVTVIDICALSVIGVMTGIFLVLAFSPIGKSA